MSVQKRTSLWRGDFKIIDEIKIYPTGYSIADFNALLQNNSNLIIRSEDAQNPIIKP